METVKKTETKIKSKMKRGKKVMLWVLGIIAALLICVLIYFKIPYSPIKSEFAFMINSQIAKTQPQTGVFTEEDIAGLPAPVQKYIRYCGYIGKPKMSNLKAYYDDVDFVLSPDKPKLKIKYTQYNFADEPVRIAFIDTSMNGIPFQGLDSYYAGQGAMKGMLAKAITLFNQTGDSINKSTLVTCLAEALFIPSFALQDFIAWEEIDDIHAKATISYYGLTASGIFEFNETGEMTRFTTDDRESVDTSGNVVKAKWSAVCGDYKEKDGIKYPTSLQGVWHYETGDLVYFDGRGINIEYDVTK